MLTTILIVLFYLNSVSMKQRDRDCEGFKEILSCWSDGKWVKTQESHALYEADNPCLNNPLQSKGYVENMKYIWKPFSDKCPYKIPSYSDFCEVIYKKNILFVGDSITYLMFSTIGGFADIHDLKKATGLKGLQNDVKGEICHHQATIHFVRNDALTLVSNDETGVLVGEKSYIIDEI